MSAVVGQAPSLRAHRVQRWTFLVWPLVGLALLWFFSEAAPLLFTSLMVSWGLFYILNPVVDWMESHSLHRTFACALLLVGMVLAMWMSWTQLMHFSMELRNKVDLDVFQKNIVDVAEHAIVWSEDNIPALRRYIDPPRPEEPQAVRPPASRSVNHRPPAAKAAEANVPPTLRSRLDAALNQKLVEWVPMLLKKMLGLLPNLVLIPYFTFFFLKDSRHLKKKVVSWIPNRYFEPALKFLYEMDRRIHTYLKGVLLDCILVGLLVWAGSALVGAPHPVVFGLISGILNSIPLLGPLLYGAICAILTVGAGKPEVLLGFVGVFVLSRVCDDLIFTPAIFGKSNHLHAVLVVSVVLLGEAVAGAWGMFLAIPVASIVILGVTIIREITMGHGARETGLRVPAPFA